MRTLRPLAALAVLAAALLAWLAWRGPAEESAAAPPVAAPVAAAAVAPAELVGTAPPAAERDVDAPRRALRPEAAPEETGPRELAAEPASAAAAAPDESTRELRVVHAASGEPVPGAAVFVLEVERLAEEDLAGLFAGGMRIGGFVREHGSRQRADARGRARLPDLGEEVLVAAEAEGVWGMRQVDEDEDVPVVLEVAPERAVPVRVVDRRGAPVEGVRVGLRVGEGAWRQDVLQETTGPDGVGRLRHVATFVEQMNLPDDVELAVAIAALLVEPVQAPLDADALPDEPIELVLPPCGAVEVVAEAPGGELPAGPLLAWLGPGDAEQGSGRWLAGGQARPLDAEGRAVFEHVAVGLPLLVAVSAGVSRDLDPLPATGPRREGERVTLRLPLAPRLPTLVVRVLAEDGTPLGGEIVEARVEATRTRDRGTHRTGEDGTLRVGVDEPVAPGEALALVVRLERGETSLVARTTTSGPLPPGEVDLGDLRLVPPPLLASGRVVDARGEGVRGAEVEVRVPRERGGWTRGRGLDTRSGVGGAFEVRGLDAPARLRLAAERVGHAASDALEVGLGARGVVLALPDEARIVGRLLVDEGVPLSRFDVEARAPGTDERLDARDELDEDGAFALRALRPGVVDVVVEPPDADGIVVAEAVVAPGGETVDLGEVDLRGRVHTIVLDVRTPEGRAPRDGTFVTFRRPGGPWRREWEDDREVRLVAVDGPLEVVVAASGWLAVDLGAVAPGRREVVLEPAPRVRLELAEEPELPPGVELRLSLESGALPTSPSSGEAPVRGGVAEVHAPALGVLAVRPALRSGREHRSFPSATPATVEVGRGDDGRTLRVALDVEDLERRARELADR